jgi:hypothetical protein
MKIKNLIAVELNTELYYSSVELNNKKVVIYKEK